MKLYDGNAKGKRSFGDFIEIDTETKRVQFPVYVNKKQKSNNITRKEILKILIHFYIVFFHLYFSRSFIYLFIIFFLISFFPISDPACNSLQPIPHGRWL